MRVGRCNLARRGPACGRSRDSLCTGFRQHPLTEQLKDHRLSKLLASLISGNLRGFRFFE